MKKENQLFCVSREFYTQKKLYVKEKKGYLFVYKLIYTQSLDVKVIFKFYNLRFVYLYIYIYNFYYDFYKYNSVIYTLVCICRMRSRGLRG